jgi:hypothetical protein
VHHDWTRGLLLILIDDLAVEPAKDSSANDLCSEEEGPRRTFPRSASRLFQVLLLVFPTPPYVILIFRNQGPPNRIPAYRSCTYSTPLARSGLDPQAYITSRDYVTTL